MFGGNSIVVTETGVSFAITWLTAAENFVSGAGSDYGLLQ